MPSLKERIDADLKDAMRSKDELGTSVLRMLKSAVKYKEVEPGGHALEDPGVLAVVQTLIKQRRESVEQFRAGGRPELVREAFERALQDELQTHEIQLACLAGFLRLLTPWFVRQWDGRLLNIHPALLPAFKGLDTHARAIATGATQHGATVHFVVPEMDSGPIIAQAAVAVQSGDTEAALAARVLEVEHRIYPQALRWVAEGRVRIADGRCLIDGQPAATFS